MIRNLTCTVVFVISICFATIADADVLNLYGVGQFQDLITVDCQTGQPMVVGNSGWGPFSGMTFDSNQQTLYAMSSYSFSAGLFSIDPMTADTTLINYVNRTSQERFNGLAFDTANDILYGASNLGELVSFDTSTGDLTSIGPTGTNFITGLAYDDASGMMYGVDSQSLQLMTLNTSTGAASPVGSIGYTVNGLSFHPTSGQLFGMGRIGTGAQSLITINRNTGAGTLVAEVSYADINGLAFASVPEPSMCTFLAILSVIPLVGRRRREYPIVSNGPRNFGR